jgi:hypothetical protein
MDGPSKSGTDDTDVPQANSVWSLAARRRLELETRDKDIDRIRDLRYMRLDPVIPGPYELTTLKVKTPLVGDQITKLVGNLTANGFMIHVPPPTPGPQGQRKASFLEHACMALYQRLIADARRDLFHKYFDSAVESGEGIIKVLWEPHRWDQFPDKAPDEPAKDYTARSNEFKKKSRCPISWRIIDRRTYYPFYDDDGLAQVIEIAQRPRTALYDQFGKDAVNSALEGIGAPIPDSPSTSTSPGQKLTLIEYWDREWVCYVVTTNVTEPLTDHFEDGDVRLGGLLRAFKHGYNRVPYFAGFGDETSSDDPNYMGQSAAYGVKDIVPLLDSQLTMWGNVAFLTGYPSFKRIVPPGSVESQYVENTDAEGTANYPFEPGMIYEQPEGGDMEVIDFGTGLNALTAMIGQLKEMVNGTLMPSIMQGVPPGSRTAAFAIQNLTESAKQKYNQCVTNAKFAWSEAFNFTLWLIEEKVRQPVYLLSSMTDEKTTKKYMDWFVLGPEDINGYYNVEVEIKPHVPSDQMQQGVFEESMVKARLHSRLQAMENTGDEHPDETDDQIAIEEYMMEPDVKAFIVQQAVQRAGLGGLNQEIEAARKLAEMSNQFAADRLKNLTGQGGAPAGQGGAPGMQQSPGGPPPSMGNNGAALAPQTQVGKEMTSGTGGLRQAAQGIGGFG